MPGDGSADVAGRLDTGDCTTTDCVPMAGARVMRTRSSPSEISSSPIPELSNSSIRDLSLRRSMRLCCLGVNSLLSLLPDWVVPCPKSHKDPRISSQFAGDGSRCPPGQLEPQKPGCALQPNLELKSKRVKLR